MSKWRRIKVYVVDNFLGNRSVGGRTALFHTLLFHGRQQEKSYRLVDPCLGDDYVPLRLNRLGTFVPPIASPTVNRVVSEQVREALDAMPFGFEPVHFRKLIDYPYYPPGDFRFESTPEYLAAERKDLLKFFEYLPNVPGLHKNIGPFYELLVRRLDVVKEAYPNGRSATVTMKLCMPFDVTFRLSAALLDDHPIVWDYHHILSERAFTAVAPFLDREFFEIVEAEV